MRFFLLVLAFVGGLSLRAGETKETEIRAVLMHLGWNMWSDVPVKSWGPYKTTEELSVVCAADRFRTDVGVWNRVTERFAADGCNMIVIDLGEALAYPSHPELAVEGSWSPERMRAELRRLRTLGLEPVPKLNFSASHDTWLKEYGRMVSSEAYYRVCADVIRDVAEIFGRPRFFHLGYDEETAAHQSQYGHCTVRQGELWWHDFLWFAETVRRTGSRPWIWSDFCWHHREEFLARMPKDVLQSNWYYGREFDPSRLSEEERTYVETYATLDRAGFDQIPCGSNWDFDDCFPKTVEHARKTVSSERLKGFLMAPWFFPDPRREKKLLEASDIVRKTFAPTRTDTRQLF